MAKLNLEKEKDSKDSTPATETTKEQSTKEIFGLAGDTLFKEKEAEKPKTLRESWGK